MNRADVYTALRVADGVTADRLEDSGLVLDLLLARAKRDGDGRRVSRELPISPVELRRMQAALVALLDALDLAHEVRPQHFEVAR